METLPSTALVCSMSPEVWQKLLAGQGGQLVRAERSATAEKVPSGQAVAAHAVERGRAGHAGRARLVREGARQALEAEVALRVGLVLGDYSPAGTRCRWRTRAARRCLGCTARRRCR